MRYLDTVEHLLCQYHRGNGPRVSLTKQPGLFGELQVSDKGTHTHTHTHTHTQLERERGNIDVCLQLHLL